MALSKIPDDWKADVCRILEEVLNGEDPSRIQWTLEARQDWENQSVAKPEDVAYETLLDVLSDEELMGRSISLKKPPGTSWDFTFEYASTYGTFTFYSKICLLVSRDKIRIVSLHLREKGTLR